MTALHTAARRFCEGRREHGARLAGATEPAPWAARLAVLEAMLDEVERFVPADLASLKEARETLALAAEVAEDLWARPPRTRRPAGSPEARAISEERELLAAFVSEVTEAELAQVGPLPFRRSLGRAETAEQWQRLQMFWDVDEHGAWYPIRDAWEPNDEFLVFRADDFHRALPPDVLRALLRDLGARRIWEVWELHGAYEIDVSLIEPEYGARGEGYWASGGMDWLLYASHQGSVTVGGTPLMEAVRHAWPRWAGHLYGRPQPVPGP